MREVLAVVEGATERNFIRSILAPDLAIRGISLRARIVGKPGKKGGARHWNVVERDIRGLSLQRREWHITTMFDLYGLHSSWPGMSVPPHISGGRRATLIETEMIAAIEETVPESVGRFYPYVWCYEFEAMLFCDGGIVSSVLGVDAGVGREIDRVREESGGCEGINSGFDTAPSRRFSALVPGYSKVPDSVRVLRRLGLPRIRSQCPHFDAWLHRIEALS